MSLMSQILIQFDCASCGAESVDSMDRVAKRHPSESICALCEVEAEAAVIGLVVDVAVCAAEREIADPYTRTGLCIPPSWHVEDFSPPLDPESYTRWIMLLLGLLAIAAGVAAATVWRGL